MCGAAETPLEKRAIIPACRRHQRWVTASFGKLGNGSRAACHLVVVAVVVLLSVIVFFFFCATVNFFGRVFLVRGSFQAWG